MQKRKKRTTGTEPNLNTYDFSNPISYFRSDFGRSNEDVGVFTLNLTCGQLLADFKIFEDMNSVEHWPVSTLIQRELDHNRAKNIANDYLLKDGGLKFFPSLTAVLIPTDDKYQPIDEYLQPSEDSLNAFTTKFYKGDNKYLTDGYESPKELVGGIFDIVFDESQGDIGWDKNKLTAVIIDGQHRLKSLEAAVAVDKSFMNCKLNITLIDVTKISKSQKQTPTKVARDLFVTINHTPEQIDEARLCLMDDKDALSTFTQVLVDDADTENKPAIRPELVDWDCEGGKHRSENSLSGVLVLRQIILTALFDNVKLSSIEDRQNKRTVSKWLSKVDAWLGIDELIKDKLGENESLGKRFDIANNGSIQQDESDEDSLFLFSYNNEVSELLKSQFKALYLSTFRHVYSNLSPFKDINDVAEKNNIFKVGSSLNRYFRSFKGKRLTMKKDIVVASEVDIYEKELREQSKSNIAHTVMGQKAIFKTLFDNYLFETAHDEFDILNATKKFTQEFNNAYDILTTSNSFDENLFSIEFEKKGRSVSNSLSVGSKFWKGIILKVNDEIDYSTTAVKILSGVFDDLIVAVREDSKFEFSNRSSIIKRHESHIKRIGIEFGENNEDDENAKRNELAVNVVAHKEKVVNKLINKYK